MKAEWYSLTYRRARYFCSPDNHLSGASGTLPVILDGRKCARAYRDSHSSRQQIVFAQLAIEISFADAEHFSGVATVTLARIQCYGNVGLLGSLQ